MPASPRAANLIDCDVLLYRGRTWIGRAIRLFDAADVNHAGIYVANGKVAEATGRGVVRRPLVTSVAKNEWVVHRRLRTRPRTLVPVRRVADGIVAGGHRYAYEQIVLLAFLCLVRRLPWGPGLDGVVRGVLDKSASWLVGLARGAREPMICSEFAFRCYDEARAGASDTYTIVIGPRGARRGVRAAGRAGRIDPQSLLAQVAKAPHVRAPATRALKSAAVPSAATLRKRFEAYEAALRSTRSIGGTLRIDAPIAASMQRFAVAWAAAEKAGAARGVQRLSSKARERAPLARLQAAAADFVTPGDLLRSASLRTVGNVARARTSRTKAARARTTVQSSIWNRTDVEREIAAILAKLAPGWKSQDIVRTTRLQADLGFDDWGVLRVVPPIRKRFHVELPSLLVQRARTLTDLVKLVWDRLEQAS